MNYRFDKLDLSFFAIGWITACIGVTTHFGLSGFLIYLGGSLMLLIWSSKK
jgi:hypothetical protein